MSSADHLSLGDYNAVCFECGRKKKASKLARNWKGYFVCPEHNEPRHPQDFAGKTPPTDPVPWSQPPSDVYIGPFPEPDPFVPSEENT